MIKILETQPNKKGILFEKFVETILKAYGYEDIRTRITKPGCEIDIEAKIERISMIGECKAYRKSLRSPELQKFFTKFYIKRRSVTHLQGVIYTLSDLNSGAKAFLQELKCEQDLLFEVYGPDEIERKLVDRGTIIPKEVVQRKVKDLLDKIGKIRPTYVQSDKEERLYFLDNINSFSLDDTYLVVLTHNMYYWIQIISSSNPKEGRYFIVSNSGGELMRNLILLEHIRIHDEYLRNNSIKPFPYGLDIDIDSLAELISIISDKSADSLFCEFISILLKNECYDGIYAILKDMQTSAYPSNKRLSIVNIKKEEAAKLFTNLNSGKIIAPIWSEKISSLFKTIADDYVYLGEFNLALECYLKAVETAIYTYNSDNLQELIKKSGRKLSRSNDNFILGMYYYNLGESIVRNRKEIVDNFSLIQTDGLIDSGIGDEDDDVIMKAILEGYCEIALCCLGKARTIFRNINNCTKEIERISELLTTLANGLYPVERSGINIQPE